jgi:hypothetical protein
MTNINNTAIPGMILPTQQAMLAGNPRDSAIAQQNAANQKLQGLTNLAGGKGKRIRFRKRGGAVSQLGTITVPQFSMQYTPQGGHGQTPNSVIQQNARVGTQGAENAKYDQYASQTGGYYNLNMNTNTNQYEWGCYSGGKKYRKKGGKTNRKKRTKGYSSKRNKLHKTRKNRTTRKI